MGGRGWAGWSGVRGGGEWDNCNSIMNKYKKNRQGEGKNNVGNVEAKELISMTHGQDL